MALRLQAWLFLGMAAWLGLNGTTSRWPSAWLLSGEEAHMHYTSQGAHGTSAATQICKGEISVVLTDDCQFILTPDLVIAEDPGVPLSDLTVLVGDSNPFNSPIIDGPGEFTYVLQQISTKQALCAGKVKALDQGQPVIETVNWRKSQPDWWCNDLAYIQNIERSWKDPSYRYFTGQVKLTDACSQVTLQVEDRLVQGTCDSAFSVRLYRTFIATDAAGNRKDTTQVLTFYKPSLTGWPALRDTTVQTCTPFSTVIPNIFPARVNAFGDLITFDKLDCAFTVRWVTSETSVCGGRSIVRILQASDACTGLSVNLDTAQIMIGNFIPPRFLGGLDTIGISTGAMDCTAVLDLAQRALERSFNWRIEDCSRDIRLNFKTLTWLPKGQNGGQASDSAWQEVNYPISSGRFLSGLPIGLHALVVSASDPCGFQATDSLYFRVTDRVAPIVKCVGALAVPLGSGGVNRIRISDINSGSWDNCGPLSLQLRRMVDAACLDRFDRNGNGQLDAEDGLVTDKGNWYSVLGDWVDVFCCDANAPVIIELWGQDQYGNRSFCSMQVTVEDPTLPQCRAPENETVYCTDPRLADWKLFGAASIVSNQCGNMTLVELPASNEVNGCGKGTIIRRWQAVKYAGSAKETRSPVCEQIITVEPFRRYDIRFPADTTVRCDQLNRLDTLYYQQFGCDLLSVTVTDDRQATTEEGCFKVFRKYRVINWCEYDGVSPAVQVGRDLDQDGKAGDEAVWTLVRPDGFTYFDRDRVETNQIPAGQGYWTSSRENPVLASRGIWEYLQVIEVIDDLAPRLTINEQASFPGRYLDCSGDVNISFSVTEDCTPDKVSIKMNWDRFADGIPDGDIAASLIGTYPRYRLVYRMPVGKHLLQVAVADGCGNVTQRTVNITVTDAKVAAPVCVNGLVVNLNPVAAGVDADGDGDTDRGAVTVWAKDFVASPGTDCGGPVRYSLHKGELIESGKEKPSPDHDFLVLTCDDRPTVLVYVYAWDASGNYDYCETYVLVQDVQDRLCPLLGSASVSGVVENENGIAVKDVEMRLSGRQTAVVNTGAQGTYLFSGLSEGQDYAITPYLDAGHRDGVTTYDIVLISQHILGEQLFHSPYQYIAADVDRSGTVSTLDILQIRKLVLSIDLTFRQNTSWRFVDADYIFKNPANPLVEVFPESRTYNNLSGHIIEADFVGIKIGDISGNANEARSMETRSGLPVATIGAPDLTLEAGRIYKVAFRLPEGEWAGLQMAIRYDARALDLLQIEEGIVKASNVSLSGMEDGLIPVSWNNPGKRGFSGVEDLFQMVFEARQSGKLSDFLSLDPRQLAAEAYTGQLQIVPLELAFISEHSGIRAFELMQNRPNPFNGETIIEFYLPGSTEAKLVVRDLSGRIVYVTRGQFDKGLHSVSLQANDLPASGLFYYTLETPGNSATRKMMVVK